MWRISCVTITAVPTYITLGFLLGSWMVRKNLEEFGGTVVIFCTTSGVMVYIIPRAVTLVLAFTSS